MERERAGQRRGTGMERERAGQRRGMWFTMEQSPTGSVVLT
jgi:hypothetical protein